MFTCPVCGADELTSKPYEQWPPTSLDALTPPYEDLLGRALSTERRTRYVRAADSSSATTTIQARPPRCRSTNTGRDGSPQGRNDSGHGEPHVELPSCARRSASSIALASTRHRGQSERVASGITFRHTWVMVKAISVRLDDDAERALRTLEASGLSQSEAIRSSLLASADRLRRGQDLAAEAAALDADDADRAEMLSVAALMESLRAPG